MLGAPSCRPNADTRHQPGPRNQADDSRVSYSGERRVPATGAHVGFEAASGREWLETDGTGGWASASITGANTRRYHGLLVVASEPPERRLVLLSRLDAVVEFAGVQYRLGCSAFAGSDPAGEPGCDVAFSQGLFPEFRHRVGTATVERSIVAVHGCPAVVIRYRLRECDSSARLTLRPLFAGRQYHQLRHADGPVPGCEFRDGVLVTDQLIDEFRVHLSLPSAEFDQHPDWWYRFSYWRERERGFDHVEDLWTPGVLGITLSSDQPVYIMATTEASFASADAADLFHSERKRRQGVRERAGSADDTTGKLVLAADQFLVEQPGRGRSVIAGYHWFGSWGRDTMISLPGLTLPTGRADCARQILLEWSDWFSEGMLPNRFPDDGQDPEYNSVDAALWYFVALHAYWKHSVDDEFVARLLPTLRDVVAWHRCGTRHGIKVDTDGLLTAGEPDLALTWMDARIDGGPVTPRSGKAVEICALWINVLRIMAKFEYATGNAGAADPIDREANRAARNFSRLFWNRAGGYLHDVIGTAHTDSSIRPNQLLALSLPFPLLSVQRRRSVLAVVEKELLTPVGLRTLAADDPGYHPSYVGDAAARDSAYHQGTVWPWLLGPYVDSLILVRGERGRDQAHTLLRTAIDRLFGSLGTGSIPEICDAEPPHTPRGAIAQAWSVAEILRAWRLSDT